MSRDLSRRGVPFCLVLKSNFQSNDKYQNYEKSSKKLKVVLLFFSIFLLTILAFKGFLWKSFIYPHYH